MPYGVNFTLAKMPISTYRHLFHLIALQSFLEIVYQLLDTTEPILFSLTVLSIYKDIVHPRTEYMHLTYGSDPLTQSYWTEWSQRLFSSSTDHF